MERQEGHLPGFVKRSRFLKTNPQFLQEAEITVRRLPALLSDRRRCSR